MIRLATPQIGTPWQHHRHRTPDLNLQLCRTPTQIASYERSAGCALTVVSSCAWLHVAVNLTRIYDSLSQTRIRLRAPPQRGPLLPPRSEERRVGKEWRSRWSP